MIFIDDKAARKCPDRPFHQTDMAIENHSIDALVRQQHFDVTQKYRIIGYQELAHLCVFGARFWAKALGLILR